MLAHLPDPSTKGGGLWPPPKTIVDTYGMSSGVEDHLGGWGGGAYHGQGGECGCASPGPGAGHMCFRGSKKESPMS